MCICALIDNNNNDVDNDNNNNNFDFEPLQDQCGSKIKYNTCTLN